MKRRAGQGGRASGASKNPRLLHRLQFELLRLAELKNLQKIQLADLLTSWVRPASSKRMRTARLSRGPETFNFAH
jgi:hypothetical protein